MQPQDKSFLASGDMLTLASVLILMFVIKALFNQDIDDDDDPSGGIMQPIYVPKT